MGAIAWTRLWQLWLWLFPVRAEKQRAKECSLKLEDSARPACVFTLFWERRTKRDWLINLSRKTNFRVPSNLPTTPFCVTESV